MKKLPVYAMALLLVPWVGCQDKKTGTTNADNTAGSSPSSSLAEMILPTAKDTTLPSGRHNIYLISGRDRPGLFVERSDFPAGYLGMPHVHNEDLYVTVLKGSVYFALGDKLDTTVAIKPYGPGSFFVIPADRAHYEWFTEPCTMQIEGMGPQSTYYLPEEKKANP